jgi:D-sedoheptulose 7-phosphate isomerase
MKKNWQNVVEAIFNESILAKQKSLEFLLPKIISSAELMAATFKNGGKILVCGNGGSACDAEHFVCELVNRLEKERKNLPAISLNSSMATLTAIANDYSYKDIFAKQILALGQKEDLLMVISTSGNSENISGAIRVATTLGMKVIALTGRDGGNVAKILSSDDVELRVPDSVTRRTPRIQETHILIIHTLCELLDGMLFNLCY